jgi:uncharacterized membrane-anchored protein YitT (DUF2179 family)
MVSLSVVGMMFTAVVTSPIWLFLAFINIPLIGLLAYLLLRTNVCNLY